ncbi:MAG TPA: hypothetical protein PKH14_02790 [Syntrophorhabdus sp.]|jgi:SSS family transporter|nr:hypothetical protein [Syntrophorhabdus sp.]
MENYIPMAITILVIYLLMNVGVGLYGMRKIKSAESYYTSGHAMGPWAVALAFGATCYSATLIIGFGGKAYDVGASLMWVAASNLLFMTYLVWALLGKRVRKLQEKVGAFTVTEMLVKRYRTEALRPVLAIVVAFSMIAYTVAVLTGTARLFEVLFHIPFFWALIIVIFVIGFYVTTGGIVSTVYNDFLQGIVMFIGMVLLFLFVYSRVGFTSGYELLGKTFGETFVSMPGNITWWSLISICLVTSLIPWGMPQIVHYMFIARDAKAVNRAIPIVTIWTFVIVYAVYYVGPMARVILGDGIHTDKVIPTLIATIMPPLAIGIILSSVAAASMSTMAGTSLQASFALSRDLYQKTISRGTSDEKILFISKIITICVIVFSALLAYKQLANIAETFMIGAAASCASFIPILLCGLYWKRGTGKGAIASSTLGFVTVVIWSLLFGSDGQGAGGIHAIIPGQIVSWLTFPIASLLTKPLDPEFIRKIMD